MIFRKIKDILFPPLEEPQPAFSQAERMKLQRLSQDDGFSVFLDALDKEVQVYAEQLTLGQLTTDDIHYIRGIIRGLREGPKLIQRILMTGAQYDEYRKRIAERSNAGDDAVRALSYASPFWDS